MNGHQIVIVGFMKIVIGLAESISILILLAILTVIKNDKKIKKIKKKTLFVYFVTFYFAPNEQSSLQGPAWASSSRPKIVILVFFF